MPAGLTLEYKSAQPQPADELKQAPFSFELKELKDEGEFEAYASVFGNMDSYRDVMSPGAFKKTIREHKSAGTMPALCWQHRWDQLIGKITDMKEDGTGLLITGKFNLGVQRGAEAYAMVKHGDISTLSIGYAVRAYEIDEKKRTRTINEVTLYECSFVTFPANPMARLHAVKAALSGGNLPTIREFEALLKAEGFSRAQAIQIINDGYKSLAIDDPDVMRDADDAEMEAKEAEEAAELVLMLMGLRMSLQ